MKFNKFELTRSLDLNTNIIKNFMEQNLNADLITYLKEHFTVVKDCAGKPIRCIVEEEHLDLLASILNTTTDPDLIKEIYKCLRNLVVNTLPEIQDQVLGNEIIFNRAIKIIIDGESSNSVALQFLCNCIVRNPETALMVWNVLKDHLISCVQKDESSYHASALLFNILHLHPNLDLPIEFYEIIVELSDSIHEPKDYFYFLVDFVLFGEKFYASFDQLKERYRLAALECMVQRSKRNFKLGGVSYLIAQFMKLSDNVLQNNSIAEINAEELVLLMEFLSALSGEDRFVSTIQADKGLLLNCIRLIKIATEVDNPLIEQFVPMVRIAYINSIRKEQPINMKSSLIRIIGNMCYLNKENQNQIREMGVIPILMNCSKVDPQSPFITQWCILAIRNLCENNLENQAYISNMRRTDAIDSATMEQFGLKLDDDGSDELGILPMNSVKKLEGSLNFN